MDCEVSYVVHHVEQLPSQSSWVQRPPLGGCGGRVASGLSPLIREKLRIYERSNGGGSDSTILRRTSLVDWDDRSSEKSVDCRSFSSLSGKAESVDRFNGGGEAPIQGNVNPPLPRSRMRESVCNIPSLQSKCCIKSQPEHDATQWKQDSWERRETILATPIDNDKMRKSRVTVNGVMPSFGQAPVPLKSALKSTGTEKKTSSCPGSDTALFDFLKVQRQYNEDKSIVNVDGSSGSDSQTVLCFPRMQKKTKSSSKKESDGSSTSFETPTPIPYKNLNINDKPNGFLGFLRSTPRNRKSSSIQDLSSKKIDVHTDEESGLKPTWSPIIQRKKREKRQRRRSDIIITSTSSHLLHSEDEEDSNKARYEPPKPELVPKVAVNDGKISDNRKLSLNGNSSSSGGDSGVSVDLDSPMLYRKSEVKIQSSDNEPQKHQQSKSNSNLSRSLLKTMEKIDRRCKQEELNGTSFPNIYNKSFIPSPNLYRRKIFVKHGTFTDDTSSHLLPSGSSTTGNHDCSIPHSDTYKKTVLDKTKSWEIISGSPPLHRRSETAIGKHGVFNYDATPRDLRQSSCDGSNFFLRSRPEMDLLSPKLTDVFGLKAEAFISGYGVEKQFPSSNGYDDNYDNSESQDMSSIISIAGSNDSTSPLASLDRAHLDSSSENLTDEFQSVSLRTLQDQLSSNDSWKTAPESRESSLQRVPKTHLRDTDIPGMSPPPPSHLRMKNNFESNGPSGFPRRWASRLSSWSFSGRRQRWQGESPPTFEGRPPRQAVMSPPPTPPSIRYGDTSDEDSSHRSRRSKRAEGPSTPTTNSERRAGTPSSEPLRSTEIVRSVQQKLAAWDLQATTDPSVRVSGSLDHSNDSSLSEQEEKDLPSKKPKGLALKRPEIPEVLRHRQAPASPTLSLNQLQRCTSVSEQGSNSVSVKSSERFNNLKHSENSHSGPSSQLSRSNSEKISIDLTGSNSRGSGIAKIDVRKSEKIKLHNGFPKTNDGLKLVEPSAFTVRIEVKNSECKSLEAPVPSNITQDNSRSRTSKSDVDSLTNAALNSDFLTSSDSEMGAKADKQCSVEVEGSKDLSSERGKHSPTRIVISSSPTQAISREALEKSVPASKTHGPNRIEMYHRDRHSPVKAITARNDISGSSDKSDSEAKVDTEIGNGGFKGSTTVYVKSEQIPKSQINSEREAKRTAASKPIQKTTKKEPAPDRLKRSEGNVHRQQSPDKRSSSEKSSKSSGSKTDSSPTREGQRKQNHDSPSKQKTDRISERHQNGTVNHTEKSPKEIICSSKSNLSKRVEKEKSPEKGHSIKSDLRKEMPLKKSFPYHSKAATQFGSPKREISQSPTSSKSPSSESSSVERKPLSPGEESEEQSEESRSSDSDLVTAPEDSPATNLEISSRGNDGATVIVIGDSSSKARSSDDSDVSFLPADENNLSWKTSELSSILKKRPSVDETQRQSKSPERHLLSRMSDSDQEYKSRSFEQYSILRKKSSSEESDDRSRGSETHSILKNRSIEERSLSPEPHSILKQRCSTEDLDLLSEPKPILKKKSSSEDLDFSDPKPILKKKSSTDDEEKPRPILKSRQRSGEDFDSGSDSSTSRRFRSLSRELENFDVDIRPILRSRMSLDEESSKPVSILKSSGSEDCSSKPQSILKSRSTTELEERVVPILKSRRDESEERAFSSILRTRSESEGEESSNSSTPVTTPVRPTSLLLPNEMEEKAESKSSLSSSASLSPLLPSILKKRAKEVHPLATPHTELAGILRAQRKLESPEDEEENRRITPIDIPDEGEDGPRISVAERIFQMETKLEDERNRSCQSPWRSGQSTPRGFRSTAGSTPPFRSGECTPRLDEKIAQLMQCYKPISDEQLLSRLEDVAQSSRQKRRNRTGDRYRTQPVTSDELEETDSLASVQSFRRMVLTRASLDAFKQREKEHSPRSPTDKKTEFPQPFRPEHRKDRNKLRYRTLPITQEELNEAERMSSARAAASQGKTSEPGSSTATQDEDEDKGSDDEILHMSVAAKASLFMHMQAQKAAPQTSTVRRYINRRGLQRSQTQPITVEELHEASKVADEDSNGSSSGTQSEPKPIKKQNSVSNINDLSTMSETEKKSKSSSESDDDFTKMSLAERVKFFNLKVLEDKLPSQKPPLSGAPMRKRRFKTQPVTTEEVEKAQALKVSPLAASLAKPPEPEILGTLPIQAARDLMYKHGEEMLTKTSSNRQSSAATSTTTQEQTKEPSGNSVGLVIKSSSIKKSTEAKDEQKIQSCSQSSTTIVNCVTEATSDTTKKAVSTHQQDIQCKSSMTKTVESESKTIKVSSSEMQVETSETSVKSTTVGVYSSNDDDSSSTSSGREVKRIKNEAVNRRRNAALRKMEERRSCCDLVGTETAASSARMQAMLHAHHQRSNTEPLTKLEKEEAKEAEEIRGGTVAERLAALQKSGEEEWRKRVPLFKDNDIPVLKTKEKESTPESKVRERRRSRDERPSSIVDRINLLETAQQSWKQRVEEKDTSKFTVAGKMGRSPKVSQESPLTDRQKRTPKAAIFRSKTADLRELQQKADISTPVKIGSPLVHRSISMPNNDIDSLASLTDSEEENNSPIKVAIPKADDETFQAFFESVNSEKLSSQKVEINEDVFEQIVSESRQMLKIQKRTVKKQGRKIGSRNPLKTLAERSDIQNEYTEVKSGFAEKEFKRIKVEQFAKNSDLAISALAGLASKEDFTAIALKKSTIAINSPLLPYKDLMLIQVKGRRHVQSRLVEPSVKSINKGDNYILVTPSEVYCWIGEFSNVIERSRAAEISTMIQTKRDLGCKSSSEVITIDEEKKTARNQAKNFFKLLGGEEQSKEAANPEEDELYESAIIDTNMIYKVEGDELVPYEEYWGNIPKYEMLNSKQVLVFDFGSEMYVWQGKQAPFELRKKAIRLAKELWEQGYDYSACDISPIHNLLNDSSVPKEGKQRPSWALFAKMNQHMETVLFREKFLDWPDMSRVIKVKRQESDEKVDTTSELTPCDAKEMLEQELKEPDLILEGSHVGRGISFWDEAENRNYEITTLGIKVWHILEYDRTMLPRESWGQFHSGDTYVIRWQFMVTVAGRDLSGQISRHSFVGRERCAYFFWQGKDSTINEKGASALMTVELDEERGPHVRVSQGSEPPSFLNLFDGTMIIHNGKREVENDETEETDKTKSSWRMFMVRGEFENEAFLVEIKRSKGALRSRGSYILTNTETGLVFVWHGVKTQTHTREIANFTAENLKQSRPMELGVLNGTQLEIKVIQEGKETKEFLAGLGDDKQSYHSLVKSSLTFDYTPRLYYLSSVSGIFMATEILCPFRSIKLVCSFPFLQSELYKTQQPALFLLDNHHEVFLWQGWWPEADDDNDNTATGSAKIRWNVDRRCAMQTAMLYCKAKNPDSPPTAYLVSAGLEPLAFTNLFPEWELHEEITAQNLKEGKNIGEQLLVEEVLSHLTRTRYSLDELQDDPLPEGVDPSRLESYLADDEFQDVLKMTKEEFYNLPEWKQTNLKKMAELF